MALIETMTFRLVDGADEGRFLAADERAQADFAYQQPGLVRRTTARAIGDRAGEWIVVTWWGSEEAAVAAAAAWEDDAAGAELRSMIDAGTREVRRYTPLE
jgi:hypothetical protein